MYVKWLHLPDQKVRDFRGSGPVHCHCLKIFLRLHVIQHSAIHRDDRKADPYAGSQFPNCRRRLFCCDREEHAVLNESVELYPGEGGEAAVLAEEDVIDARYEQRFPVTYPWEMDRIGQNCNADTYDRIKCSVEHKNVGVGVIDMVHRDAEEDDC